MLGMTSDRTYLGIKKLREGFFSLVIEEKGRNELSKIFLVVLTVILASRDNKSQRNINP
jgi:hypothetical protein